MKHISNIGENNKNNVTVIIPTYNREHQIEKAINSVLDQTRPVREILVIDDGSTDNTAKCIKKIGSTLIRYFYKKNGGVASARNLGIKKAAGEWIAFLDSDDFWQRKKIENFENFLTYKPNVDFIFTNHRHVNDFGENETYKIPADIDLSMKKTALKSYLIKTSTVMVKREFLYKIGYFFREDMETCEDFELFWRLILISDEIGFINSFDTTIVETKGSLTRRNNNIELIKDDFVSLDSVLNWSENHNVDRNLVSILERRKYREAQELFSRGLAKKKLKHIFTDMLFVRRFITDVQLIKTIASVLIDQITIKRIKSRIKGNTK